MANNNPEGFTPIPEQPEVNIEATVETPARPDEMDTETVDAANTETKEDKKPSRLVKGIAGTVAGAVVLGGGIFGGLKLFGGENSDNPVSEPSVSGPEVPGPTETETKSIDVIYPADELVPNKILDREKIVDGSDKEIDEMCTVYVGTPGTETDKGLVTYMEQIKLEAVQPGFLSEFKKRQLDDGQVPAGAPREVADAVTLKAARCHDAIHNDGTPLELGSPASNTINAITFINAVELDWRETAKFREEPYKENYKYLQYQLGGIDSLQKETLIDGSVIYTYTTNMVSNFGETRGTDLGITDGMTGPWETRMRIDTETGPDGRERYTIVEYREELLSGQGNI